ncbi:MAG TPA: PqqD family protein [Acidimicrobiales bacterium]|nr:PqqD family protein [Acidimicrobiales bacterium]
MAETNHDFVKVRSDDVVWRQVGDEVLLLDTSTSEYLSVNRTGSALWPLLMEGCRRGDLARALVERFGIEEATAANDAERFLSSLQELGLLQAS